MTTTFLGSAVALLVVLVIVVVGVVVIFLLKRRKLKRIVSKSKSATYLGAYFPLGLTQCTCQMISSEVCRPQDMHRLR